MAYWTHASQRGGSISLGTRKNAEVRLDGIFQAPDDANLAAVLKELGHKPVDGVPGPCKVLPPTSLSLKEKRIEARLTRRSGEAKTPAKGTPRTKEEAHKMLREIAKKAKVDSSGTFEELEARLAKANALPKTPPA